MRIIILSLIALMFVMPALAKEETLDTEYRVFALDADGLLNVVDVSYVRGVFFAETVKTVNAGNNFAISPDGTHYADAYIYDDFASIINVATVDETEAIISSINIVSDETVNFWFYHGSNLVVQYSDLETFAPDHLVWFNGEEELVHTRMPGVVCNVLEVWGMDVMVQCDGLVYLISGETSLLSSWLPEIPSTHVNDNSELYMGSLLVSQNVASYFALDNTVFWLSYLDLALHVYEADFEYQIYLDFKATRILHIVAN